MSPDALAHGSAPRPPAGRHLGRATPWVVLALGLAGTAWAWRVLRNQEAAYRSVRLETALAQTREAVEHVVEEQSRLLLGARGLALGRPQMEPGDWRAFTATLNLDRAFPATRLLAYFPKAALEGDAAAHPYLDLEPPALGGGDPAGSLAGDPAFREAVARARDNGELAATGRLDLPDAGAPLVALILPVYRDFSSPATPQARRSRFQGAVICVSDTSRLFRPMYGGSPIAGLEVEIFEDPGCRPSGRLYDRGLLQDPSVLLTPASGARRVPLPVAGSRWELVAAFVPGASTSRDVRPRLVAVGGTLLSLLAFGLTLILARAHRRFETLAAQLQESESRFRSLAETASCAIFTYSKDIEYMNATGLRICGFALEEVIGRPLLDLVHPLDRELVRSRAEARLRGEEVPHRYEFRLVTKQGAVRWLDFSAGAIRVGDRTLGLGTAFDVTDRVEATEARLLVERKLLEAQKLESLGLLAGGVAHDFNNLLTVIQGNAGIIRDLGPDAAATSDCLRNIEETCQRASDLVRQMLAYTGRGRVHVEVASLNQVVQDITQLLAVSIPKSVELRFELATDAPLVEADVAQLQQVVMNLVTNAAEAVGEQLGVISLRTGMARLDERSAARLHASEPCPPGRYAYLEVEDTGCGMDAETLARIFDPFFTTKFTGRGLGLAAMQGIVRGHGGGVEVRSSPGAGTLFRVYLPALPEGTPLPGPLPPPGLEAPCLGEGLVLVVDDEPGIRDLARHALERAGFRTLAASEGQQAVELFRRQPEEIRLVLLDLTMPRMGGEAALREMRALRPDLPVILWSGYGQREDPGDPSVPFLRKPFRTAELMELVRRTLS